MQIPRHFNPDKPCIVAAVPSGSRSLYGGIAIAEWALFKGCAVALPGKGTDTGFHLLGAEAAAFAVDDLDGVYGPADAIGDDAQFALRTRAGSTTTSPPIRTASRPSTRIRSSTPSACGASSRSRASSSRSGR